MELDVGGLTTFPSKQMRACWKDNDSINWVAGEGEGETDQGSRGRERGLGGCEDVRMESGG